ncbi:MAG TPA: hypothetical protein VFM73_08545 [Xanthomonadaceae bacterium]|nr:hypothetical protein [Xanthomonadaceae bacterium]
MRPPVPPVPDRPRAARTPALLLAGTLIAATGCALAPQPFAQLSGLLLDPRLDEVSGLAASERHADVLWAINDGGNGARLHAIGTRGQHHATFEVDGIVNTDWEDLAAFQVDGKRYLLVADTGDNGGLRHTLQLHAIEEPAALDADAPLQAAWSVAFRWPDGPRDCEAMAVDAASGQVLLVSKRRDPAELFAVPLRPGTHDVQVAERIGTFTGIPRASRAEREENPEGARRRGQVTAADISPDGSTLAVLTYDHVLLYPRGEGDWPAAVARPPRVHDLTLLPQAEAIAWTADAHALYATGEFRPAPLLLLTPD